MAAVAHSPAFAKKARVPQSVGKEFNKADKGKTFKKGGKMKNADLAQDKKMIKRAIAMHDKQEHKGEHTNLSKLKKGGNVKKMAAGGNAIPMKSYSNPQLQSVVKSPASSLMADIYAQSLLKDRAYMKANPLAANMINQSIPQAMPQGMPQDMPQQLPSRI